MAAKKTKPKAGKKTGPERGASNGADSASEPTPEPSSEGDGATAAAEPSEPETGSEEPSEATVTEEAEEPSEPIPADDGDDDDVSPEAVLEATVSVADAAAQGLPQAREAASKLDKETLRQTIAFQLPDEWLTPDALEVLDSMSVEAQAMMLSWLALNWWAGFEAGGEDVVKQMQAKLEEEAASEEGSPS